MFRRRLHLLVLGATIVIFADAAMAQNWLFTRGELQPSSDVAAKATTMPAEDAWIFRGQTCGDAACDSCCDQCCDDCCDQCCDPGVGSWLDNTNVWFGADAYKSLGDSGLSGFSPLPFALGDSAGAVGGFNTGFGLGDSLIRAQVGASYGVYDFKGRTTAGGISDDSLEQQFYLTFGVYKRSDVDNGDRFSWGLVFDQFFGHQWGWAGNEVYLTQVRGIFGYAVDDWNELGVWGTYHANQDSVALGFPPGAVQSTIRAMNQTNLFWRHNWEFGADSMLYLGWVDSADVGSWQLGTLNTAPLNDYVSLYGNFTYVVPGSATGLVGAAEEQWNAGVGLVYYIGGKAVNRNISGQRGLPLLPVANNGTFLMTN